MSEASGSGAAGDFGNLPKWPVTAKELPDSRSADPPRSRLWWALGLGSIGGVLGLLRSLGSDSAILAGSVTGGFVVFAFIGLVVEYIIYRTQLRGRWEKR